MVTSEECAFQAKQHDLQWFESIDLDKNGQLDAVELQKALGTGNLHFSLRTIAHMIRCHDWLIAHICVRGFRNIT